jgi:hypothetical protein
MDEDEWSFSCHSYLAPKEKVPGTLWAGNWVVLRERFLISARTETSVLGY